VVRVVREVRVAKAVTEVVSAAAASVVSKRLQQGVSLATRRPQQHEDYDWLSKRDRQSHSTWPWPWRFSV
jgi:hypothetical protein